MLGNRKLSWLYVACSLWVGLKLTCSIGFGQDKNEIRVWPGIAPGSENWTQRESAVNLRNDLRVRNVVEPTLTLFLPKPEVANGAAMIVAPGGGFRFLSWHSEGTRVAQWLADHGIAAFVLKYRLNDTGPSDEEFLRAQQQTGKGAGKRDTTTARPESKANSDASSIREMAGADAAKAVKVVRERAAEWRIDPNRIGLMGFSAGGLATMNAVMSADSESMPNFAVPIYGGGTSGKPVRADAPPIFILVASDDRAATGSVQLFSEWRAANRPAELHVYAAGGHGFGMNQRGLPVDSWIERLHDWMGQQGFLKTRD